MKKTLFASLLAITLSACGPIPGPKPPIPPTPTPPAERTVAFVVRDTTGGVREGVTVQLNDLTPPGYHYGVTNHDGYVAFGNVTGALVATDTMLTQADCPTYVKPLTLTAGVNLTVRVGEYGAPPDVQLPAFECKPILPPPPTRVQALTMCMSFQGLTVQTQQYGELPWWEAPLTWLDLQSDREAVYAAKHANHNAFCPNGDTHAMVFVPHGDPLYNEWGQAYSPDKFGARDWTNGNQGPMDPKFVALVTEVRQHGFIPFIVGAEEYGNPDVGKAIQQAKIMHDALRDAPAGDLREHGVFLPGFDGVFYGWEPSHVVIPQWAAAIRSWCSWCFIAIEHQTGHIPLGEGPSDWTPTGLMKDFDAVYSEFNDDQFDDTVWQIGGRLLGPAYIRPPEQPANDDPNPPHYLEQGSPRGPFVTCAMEFGTYGYVRWYYGPTPQANDEHVAGQRAYFVKTGWTCGG